MLTDKRDSFRLGTPLTIDGKFVGNEFVFRRSAQSSGKGADVHEDLFSTAIGRDEAEAFVILPDGNSTLITHGGLIGWRTNEINGGH